MKTYVSSIRHYLDHHSSLFRSSLDIESAATYKKFHIIDYFIIDMINSAENGKIKAYKRYGLISIWKYSKIYIQYVLSRFNIVLYSVEIDTLTYKEVIKLYHDINGKFEYGRSFLSLHELGYIFSTDNPEDIYRVYGDSGLYIKYVYTNFPKLFSKRILDLTTS